MTHTFTFISADAAQALFECSVCGRQIGFALPGLGEPHAIASGDTYLPSADADLYLESCDIPVEPPVPVPEVITKRQFLIQLLRSGMVAVEEVVTLAIQPPLLMEAVLAAMPAEDALEARLSWAAMTQVERHSPLVLSAATANNIDNATLDAFFVAASEI